MTTIWTEEHDPYGAATLEFVAVTDERPLTGALWLPKDIAAGSPLALFGHGVSYDRYQLPIPYMAKRFCDEFGWASLAMDGPGHGLRAPANADETTFMTEIRRLPVLDDVVDDWSVAIEAATDRIDSSAPANLGTGSAAPDGHRTGSAVPRLAYFGLSMGTMFGLALIASRDDIEVAGLGLLGTTGAGTHFASEFVELAKSVECPTVYIMQLDDEMFPREGYLRIFDAIGAENKRLHANAGGHVAVPLEEVDFAFDFIVGQLNGTSTKRIVNR